MDWEDLKSGMERNLSERLPGLAAQLTMVPRPRPGDKTFDQVEGSSLKAGVLLLVFPRGGEFRLALTKRTERVLHHPGQISFPGGELQSGESAVRAAVRETEEELGVDLGGTRILGALTPLYIPPSNYSVFPFVALARDPLRFRPHPDEVAEVLEVPLEHLSEPATRRVETWTLHGSEVRVPFFEFRGNKIWGATAMVLAEFLALLEKARKERTGPAVGRKS